MQARQVKTIDDAKNLVNSRGISHVKVGVFDIDGILRGKYMSKQKFLASLDHGFGFCDVILGWDSFDRLYDNVSYTGWHSGYPDANVRILPDTCRDLPFENDGLFFLAEFSGASQLICPRAVLRRTLDKAASMGFKVLAGFEYEFFVFNESPASIREKHFQDLQPMTSGNFGYSVIRNSVETQTYQLLLKLGEQMDFPIEGLHEETGPGVMEAALAYDYALSAADKAALFKTFSKVALQRENKMATFMARWSEDYPGQSGHIHLSLVNKNNEAVFFDKNLPHNMSQIMQQFIAGQQQLMPELMAMIAPTINSYRRLVPGLWAPTAATVGVDNRTCAIRIIAGSEKSQRLEYRIAASDANPYIILSAVIASGLYGIEHQLKLSDLVKGNAYDQQFDKLKPLPVDLWQAAQVLKTSKMARQYFGDDFIEHFVATREWEVREFRKHISKWELERYFEII